MSDPVLDISQYFSRPFIVEAVQLTNTNGPALAEWCGGQFCGGTWRRQVGTSVSSMGWWSEGYILLEVDWGVARVSTGDYVVRRTGTASGNPEFEWASAKQMEATYSRVESGMIADDFRRGKNHD